MQLTAMRIHSRGRSQGFNLLETLVALLIVVVGLLGLAGLQARAQVAELESYQRAQALVLLYDMMDRMNNSRTTASCFVTAAGSYYGDTSAPPALTCTASNAADQAMAIASMTPGTTCCKARARPRAAARSAP